MITHITKKQKKKKILETKLKNACGKNIFKIVTMKK